MEGLRFNVNGQWSTKLMSCDGPGYVYPGKKKERRAYTYIPCAEKLKGEEGKEGKEGAGLQSSCHLNTT